MTPYCSHCSTPLPLNSVEGVFCPVCRDVAKFTLLDDSYDPETLITPQEMGEMRWQEMFGGLRYE